MKISIDNRYGFFDIDISSFLPHVGDNELTASRCGHMDSESEREQRNSGWSRSAHTPIKRISEHREGHHLLSPAVLYKRFNRHERPILSQNRGNHPSMFVYIRATATHLRHLTENSASVMMERFFLKKEVDIIGRNKWWINEELHRWSFDKP